MNFANQRRLQEGIEGLQFLTSIGMPISFAELGAKEEDIPLMVEKQSWRKWYMEASFPNTKDVEAIYRLAL